MELKDFSYLSLSAPGWDEIADVGVGRLEPFDPAQVQEFPKFKRYVPGIDELVGTSLCKLGFPFSSVSPIWNGAGFSLPPTTFPLPRFPIEGIFTRRMEIKLIDKTGGPVVPPFPIAYIETSSPGLKGQSGGPIFDVSGAIWAIQAKTMNLALGFDPDVPGKRGQTEHQFLNVGLGVHPQTIAWCLNDRGIVHELVD